MEEYAPDIAPEPDIVPDGTPEMILGADDLPLVPMHVPEWNCRIYIATLRGAERQAIDNELQANPRLDKLGAWCQMLIRKADGSHMFGHAHRAELSKKSGVVLDRIIGVAAKHNALGEDAEKEILKNS